MSTLLIALGVGIAVYTLIMIAFPKAAPEDKSRVIKAAMDQLYEENRGYESAAQDILRDQIGGESPLVRAIFNLRFMRPLYEAGIQAGFQQDVKRLLVLTVMIAVFFLLVALVKGWVLLAIGAAPLAYYIMYKYSKRQIRKRNDLFINQFPDALDMIVRSVRSGFPLTTALQMLAENAEEPVRSEFRQVVDDLALGRSLTDALGRLAIRINEPDIRFFVVVLSVQQETGGNLSEIVSNLSGVIRKRKQLRMKIRAMTSEGKATGWVLGALPVLVFGALTFVQPGYLQPFFNDSLGQTFLMVILALMGTCFFVVKQMINIDI